MDSLAKQITQLSNWTLKDNFIERVIKFDSFQDALEMMLTIGKVCDEMNHHPDWTNVYDKLTIKLTTHDSNSVTMKDIELALKIDDLIG